MGRILYQSMYVCVSRFASFVMHMPQATGLKRSSLTSEAGIGLEIPLKTQPIDTSQYAPRPPCHSLCLCKVLVGQYFWVFVRLQVLLTASGNSFTFPSAIALSRNPLCASRPRTRSLPTKDLGMDSAAGIKYKGLYKVSLDIHADLSFDQLR